jgi:hypothetical protein
VTQSAASAAILSSSTTKSSNPTLKYLRKNEERDQQNEGKTKHQIIKRFTTFFFIKQHRLNNTPHRWFVVDTSVSVHLKYLRKNEERDQQNEGKTKHQTIKQVYNLLL